MIKKFKDAPDSKANPTRRVPLFTQRISKEQRKAVFEKFNLRNPRKEA